MDARRPPARTRDTDPLGDLLAWIERPRGALPPLAGTRPRGGLNPDWGGLAMDGRTAGRRSGRSDGAPHPRTVETSRPRPDRGTPAAGPAPCEPVDDGALPRAAAFRFRRGGPSGGPGEAARTRTRNRVVGQLPPRSPAHAYRARRPRWARHAVVLGALVLAAVGGWMIGSRPLGDELAGPSPAVTPANEIEALLVRERQLLLRGLYLIEMTDGG